MSVTTAGITSLVSGFLAVASSGSFVVYSSTGGCLSGDAFVEMVRQTSYSDRLDIPSVYEVYIQKAQLHRLLLVKRKRKGSTLPLISFEVITPDLRNLKTLMREFQDRHGIEIVGDYQGTLLALCELADRVVHEMGNYRLFTNNCQHFCNNLLQEMGLGTFKTTCGPTVSINGHNDTADFIPRKVDSAYRSALSYTPSIVGKTAAVAMGYAIGAPITATIPRKDT